MHSSDAASLCARSQVNRATAYWVRSGRAESEGRLEQWYDYLALQEKYALEDSGRKAVAQVRVMCALLLWLSCGCNGWGATGGQGVCKAAAG